MKFAKTFRGVPDGECYPVEYQVGQECPPELEAAARSLGVIGEQQTQELVGGAPKTIAEIKALLDAAGIAYDVHARKADLVALLPAA